MKNAEAEAKLHKAAQQAKLDAEVQKRAQDKAVKDAEEARQKAMKAEKASKDSPSPRSRKFT